MKRKKFGSVGEMLDDIDGIDPEFIQNVRKSLSCRTVEPIVWVESSKELPDAGVTVLLFSKHDGEPVWPGYFDESTAHGYIWRSADGAEIEGVTHWAEMPAGPTQSVIVEEESYKGPPRGVVKPKKLPPPPPRKSSEL